MTITQKILNASLNLKELKNDIEQNSLKSIESLSFEEYKMIINTFNRNFTDERFLSQINDKDKAFEFTLKILTSLSTTKDGNIVLSDLNKTNNHWHVNSFFYYVLNAYNYFDKNLNIIYISKLKIETILKEKSLTANSQFKLLNVYEKLFCLMIDNIKNKELSVPQLTTDLKKIAIDNKDLLFEKTKKRKIINESVINNLNLLNLIYNELSIEEQDLLKKINENIQSKSAFYTYSEELNKKMSLFFYITKFKDFLFCKKHNISNIIVDTNIKDVRDRLNKNNQSNINGLFYIIYNEINDDNFKKELLCLIQKEYNPIVNKDHLVYLVKNIDDFGHQKNNCLEKIISLYGLKNQVNNHIMKDVDSL